MLGHQPIHTAPHMKLNVFILILEDPQPKQISCCKATALHSSAARIDQKRNVRSEESECNEFKSEYE